MCGSFYFYTMSNRIPFQKPYASAHDLVSLLQSRGLTVADTAKAERYLKFIGYYRLSAYMYPLLCTVFAALSLALSRHWKKFWPEFGK